MPVRAPSALRFPVSKAFTSPVGVRYNSSSSAQTVISSFLNNKSNPALSPIETTELLSPTHSHLLSTTLQPYLPFALAPAKDILPEGHHIVYFPTAAVDESRLDADGTETTYNPGSPFNRRMWAGGRIHWSRNTDLRIGQNIREKMELDKIEAKKRGGGGEMVVMSIRKKLFTPSNEEAVNETRQWVFLKDGHASAAAASKTKKPAPQTEKRETVFEHTVGLTPTALFRYSALTFNGHRIHYDRSYVTGEEGYPGLVVHGPLLATLLVDLARRNNEATLTAFRFRALRPLFDISPFAVCGVPGEAGRVALWAQDDQGFLCMDAEAQT